MKFIGKRWRLLVLLFLMHQIVQGQNYAKLNTFTTDHGLPSNHIYDIVEDNNGFLWIATDNGVSRFDGKYFQNFSIKDGLPSNDALQLTKEKDGTIWVNCYKQVPSYFDEQRNKFITIKNNKKLDEIAKRLLRSATTVDGNLIFYNPLGTISFKNKALINSTPNSQWAMVVGKQKIYFRPISNKQKSSPNHAKIIFDLNNKPLDSIYIKTNRSFENYELEGNHLYLFGNGKSIYKITITSIKPFNYNLDSIAVPGTNSLQKVAKQTLNVIGKTGLITIFDKHSLHLLYTVNTGPSANCSYIDHQKRLWVGTLDKGLFLYNTNEIKSINPPENIINSNFLSVGVNKNEIVAGNYYGQVLQIKNNQFKRFDIPSIGRTTWLRKLIYTKKGILAVHDLGYSLNYKNNNPVAFNHGNSYIKNALNLNDSLVIFSTNAGTIKLNTLNLAITLLSEKVGITSGLAKENDFAFFYVSSTGLAKFNVKTNISTPVKLPKNWINEKINVLASTNGFLFITTRSGKILVLKNEKEIASINAGAGLPENINTIFAYKNRIWLGSKTGIHALDYTYHNNKFNFSLKNISKTDGLPSNTINDFAAEKDIIYAATENGIAIIPAGYQNQFFEIKPQLTEVKINQMITLLANSYNLKSDQNNITLQFAGIELGGHFKNLQYAINDKTKYNNLVGNTLNIQLASGENAIYVRAVDVNNQLSKATIKLHFFIETPFYKTRWFWTLIAIAITAIVFWLYNRNRLAKQKIVFQQQLALAEQRTKITADLHDDIGASLSSLQLNSAIANQLMGKDAKKAQLILNKIENQSKNLADKIGDIIWSMKPGRDEFMTISSRIKTFANDILGSTTINYKIEVHEKLNTLIQDITLRKNLVLIAKEAINNCAKYSQASQLNLTLKLVDTNIELTITDDGIGFDTEQHLGNGLANMRKRTQELNGIFNISSSKKGTKISVVIPLVP